MEKLLQQSITIRSEEQLGFREHESPQEFASDKVLVLKSSVKSGKVLSKGEHKSPTKKPRIKASFIKGHKNTIVKKKGKREKPAMRKKQKISHLKKTNAKSSSDKGRKNTIGKKNQQNLKYPMVEEKTPEREMSEYEKLREAKIIRNQKVINKLDLAWGVLGKPIMWIISYAILSDDIYPNQDVHWNICVL